MTELTPTYAVQSYLDTTDEVSAAGIIEHLEASGFVVVDAEGLRKLVDVVWNECTESTAVPSTDWADRMIDRVFNCEQEVGEGDK